MTKPIRTGVVPSLVQEYVARAQRYAPSSWEILRSEEKLLAFVETQSGRSRATLILGDSGGRQLSSEEFAGEIRRFRDVGCQSVVLAIGPADGWSDQALRRADLVFSFGRITLPHELAAVVLAEQVYRALTILAGHPYHVGH